MLCLNLISDNQEDILSLKILEVKEHLIWLDKVSGLHILKTIEIDQRVRSHRHWSQIVILLQESKDIIGEEAHVFCNHERLVCEFVLTMS